MENRTCKTCAITKPMSEFRHHIKKGRDYWEYDCCECVRKHHAAWRDANREEIKARARARYAADLDKGRAKGRRYYANNRESCIAGSIRYRKNNREGDRAGAKRWRAKHPEHSRLLAKARRARVSGAKTESVSKADIEALRQVQGNKCAACSVKLQKFHIDHIMPLARGGEHAIKNFQLMCPSCNLSKSSKHPADFMRSRGFLL